MDWIKNTISEVENIKEDELVDDYPNTEEGEVVIGELPLDLKKLKFFLDKKPIKPTIFLMNTLKNTMILIMIILNVKSFIRKFRY